MMVTIDCNGVENARQMHELLANALSFPDYYGNNLDALFDCLTEIGEPTTIKLEGWMGLGEWKQGFVRAFSNACLEDPNIEIIFA